MKREMLANLLPLAVFPSLNEAMERAGADANMPDHLSGLQALDLELLNPGGGASLGAKSAKIWSYRTEDTPATVDTSGYFNNASGILTVGDLIYVVQVDAAAVPTSVTAAGFHVVVSNAAGVVDVEDAEALTLTDTD